MGVYYNKIKEVSVAQKKWKAKIFTTTSSQSKEVEVFATNQPEAMKIIKMMHEFKSFVSVPKVIK